MTDDADLAAAIARVGAAITKITSGDPEPYLACWSHADDVTIFAAGGSNPRGWPGVAEPLRRIARHFAGHAGHTVEEQVVHRSGDLAVTVGYQRGEYGGPTQRAGEAVLRVTHVYRREDGEWKIIHRHADSQSAAEAVRPDVPGTA